MFIGNAIWDIAGCESISELIELNRSLRNELHSKCQVIQSSISIIISILGIELIVQRLLILQ